MGGIGYNADVDSVNLSEETMQDRNQWLRRLPSVSRLLAAPEVAALADVYTPGLLTDCARSVLAEARAGLLASADSPPCIPSESELIAHLLHEVKRRAIPSLRGAINATGIVLHTGLGRARLAQPAIEALQEVAESHAPVEIDVETGRRGSRQDHVRGLLCELTGAESAAVVNNCAGAVLLAVMAVAAGREVILSRGEMVEIGGAFRMPDIIRSGGASLVEVGTTNRTRLSDYVAAITERTGLILRCHPSNFAVVGFTEEAPTVDLVALGHAHGIPVMDDQGSGALISPLLLGIPGGQGSLRQSVVSGADIVTASGDKLLGGPQAGLLLGSKAYIDRIMKHPLARALRVDKFTLAALEATLRLYRDPGYALQTIPTLRYLMRTEVQIKRLAAQLQSRLRAVLPPDRFALSLVPERSQVGGGSLPGENLPTVCVALRPIDGALSPDALAAAFRQATPAVFGRIRSDALLFDPRTLEPAELKAIAIVAGRLFHNVS